MVPLVATKVKNVVPGPIVPGNVPLPLAVPVTLYFTQALQLLVSPVGGRFSAKIKSVNVALFAKEIVMFEKVPPFTPVPSPAPVMKDWPLGSAIS